MAKIALMISLDMMRLKVEQSLRHFGITDVQHIGTSMITLYSKNFIYTDVQLIIIDIDSPDFNAFEVISNLKKGSKSNKIPIIAIGNRSDATLTTQLMALGCIEYIVKPIDDMTFSSKVLQILRDKVENHAVVSSLNSEKDAHTKFDGIKLEWSSAFETGIEDIDSEHRSIIDQFQKLYQMMKEGQGHSFYDELLVFLSNYVSTHFANEERFQEEIGFDQYEEHKIKHAFFKDQVLAFIDEKHDPVNNYDLLKLNLFVKDWLIQHIYVEDQKIGLFYKSKIE